MRRSGVEAGQLAIARGGVLQLSRSYSTPPPAGYAPVDMQSLFRIASLSKIFTCAAIDRLSSDGKVDMDAKAFALLGISTPVKPGEKPDPRIDAITVRHLVDHAGGWNAHDSIQAKDGTHIPGVQWDPTFSLRQIALDLGLSGPPSKMEMARYMYSKPLQFVPGTQNFDTTYKRSYSNFGYLLLGLIIEAVTGRAYIDFVRTGLGAESDCSKVYLSRLLGGPRDPREVWYLDPGSGPTVLRPRSEVRLPSAYGGGGFLPERMDSAGGIMTNAETLARFTARHAVWGIGGRAPGYERSGGLPGTANRSYSRPNGIDCAFVLNTRSFNGGPKTLETFVDSLRLLLDRC